MTHSRRPALSSPTKRLKRIVFEIADVKPRLNELLKLAKGGGQVYIRKHGRVVAVVIGMDEYNRLHMGYTTL